MSLGQHQAGRPHTARRARECFVCYSTIHPGQRYRLLNTTKAAGRTAYVSLCSQCRPVPPATPRPRRYETKQVRATRATFRWHDLDQSIDDLDRGKLSANEIATRLGCSARTVVRRRTARRQAAA